MIVGLSGYARSGKDSVAGVLLESGWQRRAFADAIKEAVYLLDPLVAGPLRVQQVVDLLGWEGAKNQFPEVRRLLQFMGAEVGRDLLGENVWVDRVLSDLREGNYVITDCRFPNEADAIRAAGGQVWRISRPGIGPANDHASENSMDEYQFDAHINNDSDLKTLSIVVRGLL